MQAEAVAADARGESVGEDARQVLRGDADAVVLDHELDAARLRRADTQGDDLVGAAAFVRGILRVANEVHENLQDLGLLREDSGDRLEIAHDLHGMAHEGAGVHPQGVLHQFDGVEGFDDAGHHRVGLLHRDDFLDVVDVFLERFDFLKQACAFGRRVRGE